MIRFIIACVIAFFQCSIVAIAAPTMATWTVVLVVILVAGLERLDAYIGREIRNRR